ncbi:vWA domain-containing protein [Nocardioides marmoraquaticus]
MSVATHDPDALLVGFTRALHEAGVAVTADRTASYLEAASVLGAGSRDAVRRAGRATLCHGPDDLARHDQVFEAWFTAHPETPKHRGRPSPPRSVTSPLPIDDGGSTEGADDDAEAVRAAASDTETLARRDVAAMTAAEKALLDALIGALRPRLPRRRTTRRTPWRRGELDVHRTLRASLRRMGEPGDVRWRRRAVVPRRVVLLVDVSGSMKPYADALLRLAHRLSACDGSAGRARVETFTLGTRLTRVTDPLRTADPERALVRAGEQVPDWSGGTRLGETLGAFLDRYGGLARGSVVVVLSDGWERGDATELGEQMARLQRLARRVVWANPHRGKAGYEPVQQGIAAALPHCDDFVAGHSLRSFTELLEVVARA